MKTTQQLHDLGQSLWLDNITRELLEDGTLKRYIGELSVTGLTSNPTIFEKAIKSSTAYDAAIRKRREEGKTGKDLFSELALRTSPGPPTLPAPPTSTRIPRTRSGAWRGRAFQGLPACWKPGSPH